MTESERLRQLEDRLWKAADEFRANSSLSASQYSIPVLGLIFLRYADVRFTQLEKEFEGRSSSRREIGRADELAPIVREAFATPGPVLVDVVTNPNEIALPPKTSVHQAWGFAIAKMKETLVSRDG